MDFLELVKQRYSARDYLPKAVEQAKIDYILECARLAPSAVNRQPWRFIVVQSAMPGGQCSSVMPAIGLLRPPYTLLYTPNIQRLGCVATTKRATQILMQPSPLNIFVWLQPNRSWAVVGFVTLM